MHSSFGGTSITRSLSLILDNWEPAKAGYKHVVSVSIGSSGRNAREELEVLGQKFVLERIGTDGDMQKAGELLAAMDGKVDAFGLGGADLYLVAGKRRYTFRDIAKLAAHAQQTPLLDGSGLKHTLEREAIRLLEPTIHWQDRKTLLVSAVDRFGMAEALSEVGANVLFGDFIFALNMNIPIYKISTLRGVASVVAPVVTQLPFKWFYPTGEKQEKSVTGVGTKYYAWADVIAGDTHFVKRYAPRDLRGKIILTQTITPGDRKWFAERGVKSLITTTPRIGQRNFATNVMEALFVALSGKKRPLTEQEYLRYIQEMGLRPEINELTGELV